MGRRVAIVSESFLPTLNGVTTSVVKLMEHLADRGDEAILIVPAAGSPRSYAGFRVHEVPALAYRQFPVGLPNSQISGLLARFRPDVVHVASPFLLGAQSIAAANRLGVPSVAIYQTDVSGYARRNRLAVASNFAWRIVRWIHEGADLTLAPSSTAIAALEEAGVPRLERWGRGVDTDRYHPGHRYTARAQELRAELAPDGEVILGYVGRVAPEKSIERLAELAGIPGIRIVIVGGGPALPSVTRALEGMPVTYLGELRGEELSAAYASFDVFVHTGTEETFGQTLQEAHASGLAVVAPRAGGPIDLIDDGTDGLLYDPAVDGALAAAVRPLVADGALRARMGEAGRRKVIGRTWHRVCDELLGRYDEVIAARRTTTRSLDVETK
ncbi:glycosyltransferase family 1 protein [uncultured Schumannella sp.]|uniref:glycosyltransferase family 4 protein n=1 Tax=uncultured Schumannella sp. TaxID=1195956 RepID=UPI0025D94D71|nr:glycosyltransferase family 1 protein [uncultured Schumannella sp.]